MRKFNGLLFSVMVGLSLVLAGAGDAHAKRMGGGKSFGSKPSYSETYKAPAGGANQAAPFQQPGYQSPASRNQTARESMAKRGGLMGMLGGLALGGMLGAMLFGGAFEHINFLDILLFGVIAFMLFKLFAGRRQPGLSSSTAGGQAYRPEYEEAVQERTAQSQRPVAQGAGFDTDLLSGGGRQVSGAAPSVPADFDSAAFMAGAKAAYTHLQAAWDRSDLAELRGLTTDKVFAELQDQLRERSGPNLTEILKADARLLEVRDVGADREATVLFDVLMREAPGESPVQTREVWHFVRSRFSKQPTWFLDGIQQLEG